MQNALTGYRQAAKGAIKRGYNDTSTYGKYIAEPDEISARLTQYRILPKRAKEALDRLRDSDLEKAPTFYQDLRHVIGSGKAVKKASETVWAVAPIGGMLGSGLEGE